MTLPQPITALDPIRLATWAEVLAFCEQHAGEPLTWANADYGWGSHFEACTVRPWTFIHYTAVSMFDAYTDDRPLTRRAGNGTALPDPNS